MLCHQMGQEMTRLFDRSEHWDAVWERAGMKPTAEGLGKRILGESLAEWGTRIAAGEVPPAPPRPSGIERNMVITQWAWGRDDSYIHDNISTDKRNPTLYASGRVWGIDIGQSFLWALDPKTHTVTAHEVPRRDGPGRDPERLGRIQGSTSSHNPMLDDKGNVWLTTACAASEHAELGSRRDGRHRAGQSRWTTVDSIQPPAWLLRYPRREIVLIDTAFATHHLQFDQRPLVDERRQRGWGCSIHASSIQRIPKKQRAPRKQRCADRLDDRSTAMGGGYGIIVSPVDGTVWRANYPASSAGTAARRAAPSTSSIEDKDLQTLSDPAARLRAARHRCHHRRTPVVRNRQRSRGRFDPATEKLRTGRRLTEDQGTGKEMGSADFHITSGSTNSTRSGSVKTWWL
jgi:hypothetical protein